MFETRSLSELSIALRDGTHGTHARVSEGIPLLSAKNITPDGGVAWDGADDRISVAEYRSIHSSFQLQRGDLLLTIVGTLGRRAIYQGEKVTFQRSVAYIRPNPTVITSRFAFHALGHSAFTAQLRARSNATAQAGLYLGELAQTRIPSCSMTEQALIARILDTLDTQIEKTQALIVKLEQVKEGLLHDLLSRGVDENGELRPSAEEAPDLYKESALGLIPRGWATAEIGAIATKIQDGTHFSPTGGGHDFMYVTSKNIRFGYLDLTDVDWIDQRQHAEIFKRCDVRLGDLLLTKDGANTGNAALNTCPDPISLLSSVAFIRFSPQTDDAEFFLQQILSRKAQQRILDAMSGNAITRLTLEKIRAFMVRRPPVTEQRRISSAVKAKAQVIGSLNLELKQALKLKSGLMDDLLTGRVRVTPLLESLQPVTAPQL